MAPPTQLSIATSSVQRLVKEEASYHKELKQQESRVKKLEEGDDDENKEYMLKQERKAIDETKAVFPELKVKISDAVEKLKEQLGAVDESDADASVEEITKGKEALASAQKALTEIS